MCLHQCEICGTVQFDQVCDQCHRIMEEDAEYLEKEFQRDERHHITQTQARIQCLQVNNPLS